uniref:Uncharacterized protein n=1 Tax=Chromera velia CCMP2878 TaxID=1169474 RepID=A0A0G4IAK7_9ALVE|eukprot:Cvel_2129.t1-p1 / transcript=Cvel_2129.t1 / gene=Cvel_2129 / organism=Chromera_velia_CCMP2878 / gene_product=hypothetical protein / transcript_product=hypothetical protein / location=Cvel_scaffold82:89793-90863(-) / protein_length=357 / sequence_SO=supercontig / SO=protein_coding / is_pseudo=false
MIQPSPCVSLYFALALCLFSVLATGSPSFNFTKCPSWDELQAPRVREEFDVSLFEGTYFELAFHDRTQFPTCALPRCVRSVKKFLPEQSQIDDDFSLQCGKIPMRFSIPLGFRLTENVGVFEGFLEKVPWWWKIFEPGEKYPDVVVDFEVEGGKVDWVIEFQCTEKRGRVDFVGINFYSRQQFSSVEYVDLIEQRARERGLGVYLDSGFGLTRLNHSSCDYNMKVRDWMEAGTDGAWEEGVPEEVGGWPWWERGGKEGAFSLGDGQTEGREDGEGTTRGSNDSRSASLQRNERGKNRSVVHTPTDQSHQRTEKNLERKQEEERAGRERGRQNLNAEHIRMGVSLSTQAFESQQEMML